ncbi:hypothetical protein CAPTEDRAFT_213365 [Capitella teleta]|uniref:Uncharacterized protein n=1 Tax=Capitella teleta TaxID=283909 RepID=R7U0B9_CAPTE|nr:hypothetical protein CAPTEDRAFT_213365 [Capitella teleta]|eukprot:ELT99653.1 hypothetical protein CAPTEDRAFT_213365 [Capitella teleta]
MTDCAVQTATPTLSDYQDSNKKLSRTQSRSNTRSSVTFSSSNAQKNGRITSSTSHSDSLAEGSTQSSRIGSAGSICEGFFLSQPLAQNGGIPTVEFSPRTKPAVAGPASPAFTNRGQMCHAEKLPGRFFPPSTPKCTSRHPGGHIDLFSVMTQPGNTVRPKSMSFPQAFVQDRPITCPASWVPKQSPPRAWSDVHQSITVNARALPRRVHPGGNRGRPRCHRYSRNPRSFMGCLEGTNAYHIKAFTSIS